MAGSVRWSFAGTARAKCATSGQRSESPEPRLFSWLILPDPGPPAEQGLPAGAKGGAPPGQETQRELRRWLTALILAGVGTCQYNHLQIARPCHLDAVDGRRQTRGR